MYKKHLISLSLIIVMGFVFIGIQPSRLLAAPVDVLNGVCTGKATASSTCIDANSTANQTNPIYGPNGILTEVIFVISWVVGVVSVIIIIISAIRMIMSAGDSNTVNSARNAILYSLLGVVIAVSAQGIVVFILRKV